jgi:hypothetical protein
MEVELRLDAFAFCSDGSYSKRAFKMKGLEGCDGRAMADRNGIADGAQAVAALQRARESVAGGAFGVPMCDLYAANHQHGDDTHRRKARVQPTASN